MDLASLTSVGMEKGFTRYMYEVKIAWALEPGMECVL